jgi:microcystin-dependent protein
VGQGPGLSPYLLGQMGGVEAVTLIEAQMPEHSHLLRVDNANGTTSAPNNAYLARDPAGTPAYGAGSAGILAPAAVASTGSNQPHVNVQPYTTIRYCIAIIGIYPPLN